MKHVRTRYAPSPTGFLHIGGARTALFCYLLAKHYRGVFIFRVEDTDVERNVPGGERSQIDNLIWLGIIPDESPQRPNPKHAPYRQSEKLDRYLALANELINKGAAYKAYDTTEELEAQRGEQEKRGLFSFRYDKHWLKISAEEKRRRDAAKAYTVRLALKPSYEYGWDDIVRGNISVNTNDIGDWVIIKQDEYPTYNFAVVVDDHDMEITHVLRGEEHITNTPKQLAVYDAFNWTPPQFGHLTIITDNTGKKLSKRDKTLKQFVEDYKNEGYPAPAILNFLALLGWTHPQSKEIMSREELITSFDLARLSNAPTKFDMAKMHWFAKEYFKNIPTTTILQTMSFPTRSAEWATLFIETYKNGVGSIRELSEILKLYDDTSVRPISPSSVVEVFTKYLAKATFTIDGIKSAIEQTKHETKLAGKDLFLPIRLACTYHEHGAELARVIMLTGEKLIKARLGMKG